MADPLLSPATRGFREGRVTRLETAIGSWNAYHARTAATSIAFGITPAEIVIGGRDLVVARTNDGEPLRALTPSPSPVRALDVHGEGGLLLSAHGPHGVHLWDLATAEPAGEWKIPAADVRFVDGARFVARGDVDASGGGGRVTTHLVAGGREVRMIGDRVQSMAILPDGTIALAGDGRVRRVDAVSGRELWSIEWAGAGGPLAVSPEGKQLLAWPWVMQSRANRPLILSNADGRVDSELAPERVRAPGFLGWVGERAILILAGSTMERRGTHENVSLRWTVNLHDEIVAAALTPDRNFAVFARSRGGLLWANVLQGTAAPRGAAPERGLEPLFSPDGERLAIGGRRLALHRISGERESATLDVRSGELSVFPQRWSDDGWIDVRLGASVSRPAMQLRWHPDSGRTTPRVPSSMRAHSPDGEWLAGAEGAAVLLSRAGIEGVRRLEGHLASYQDYELDSDLGGRRTSTVPVEIGDLAFSADSRLLASAAGDATVRLWEVAGARSHDVLRTGDFLGHPARIGFTRDGALLLAACHSGELAAWVLATGALAWKQKAHDVFGPGLAIDSLGRWIATFSLDGTVSLRVPATGEEVERIDLRSCDDVPRAVAFDSGGRRLAVATDRGVVLLFRLGR